jgi:hypothetical protein
LNDRRKRFCLEYLVDLNATQAYIRAGYSPKAAENNATRLMGDDGVRARIAALQAARVSRTEITVDRTVKELSTMAFAGLGETNSVEEDGTVHLHFDHTPNKLRALDMLMKHQGAYAAEKLEHSGAIEQRMVDVPPRPKDYAEWIRMRKAAEEVSE